MNKFFTITAVIISYLALQPHVAHAQPLTQCTQGPAEVEVNLDYVAPQEDTTLTAIQIDQKFRNDAGSTLSSDRKGIYVGLTRSPLFNLIPNYHDFSFIRTSNIHQTCLSVKKATYTFIYHPEVYVASDFMRMACAYGVTVMHEKRHVDAYLQTANEYIPLIKKAIEDYIPQIPPSQPVPTAEADIAARQQEIMKMVNQSIRPVMQQFIKADLERQAAIDTPANYAHDSAICPGQHPVFPQ